ncbi:MAG: glycosyltransferase [Candidatus Eiseniibacteriota bacterium]
MSAPGGVMATGRGGASASAGGRSEKPMRVAHLDTGRSWRGGQAQVLQLMQGLRERGVENRLLAPPGPLADRAREAGIETLEWRSHGDFDVAATLAAMRRLGGVDVAHAHSAHAHAIGVPAARLARVPAVVVSRRVDFSVATHAFSRLKYRLPVDRYLCISRGVMDVMRSAGVPASRLALVPSGVPIRSSPPPGAADLRSLIGAAPGTPIVGTVAALAPHKNHADLLRAATIVVRERPQAHFVWVGEGECRPALERQRRDLGLESHVHLLGFRDDALGLLAQFTLFVLSSYLEGLCTSLLDAQALAVPVIATAVGGVPDVIEDGVNGRLVPGREPAALAAAILAALDDSRTSAAWAAAGRERVSRFSVESMVSGTFAVYQQVLRERSAGLAMA